MKLIATLLLAMALVASALAVNTGKHWKSSFQGLRKRKGLNKVDGIIRTVVNQLTKEQSALRTAISRALNTRNKANSHRLNVKRATSKATKSRYAAEGRYNAARKYEQKLFAKLKVAEVLHTKAIYNYRSTHSRNTRLISKLDREKRILTEIRRLLGGNRSAKYRSHKDHAKIRRANKHKFNKHRIANSKFHHGSQRFLSGKKVCKTINVKMGSKQKGYMKCPKGYVISGMSRDGAYGLNALNKFRCCKRENAPANKCYIHNVVLSFDKKGTSSCHKGYHMAGVYKNHCNKLYCLEYFKCCKSSTPVPKKCMMYNVWHKFDKPGMTSCPSGYALSGLYRNKRSCHGIHCLEEYKCCKY